MDATVDNGASPMTDALELTTEIVAAYVSNNPVQSSELSNLIRSVHETLQGLSGPAAEVTEAKPAIPVKKSVTDDYIICLEDGKKM